MDPLKPETVAAIKSDEFATKLIEAAIELVMGECRDWDAINRSGKIQFKTEEGAIVYCGLQSLIEQTEEAPCRFMINVGGKMIEAQSLQMLQAAFRR